MRLCVLSVFLLVDVIFREPYRKDCCFTRPVNLSLVLQTDQPAGVILYYGDRYCTIHTICIIVYVDADSLLAKNVNLVQFMTILLCYQISSGSGAVPR